MRLARELEAEPLRLAYLFGSQATGDAGALSDVDLAVLPDSSVKEADRLPLQARLSVIGADAFGVRQCDVVFLDEAPPALAFSAVVGRLLLARDDDERVRFEARVQSTYHDVRPHLEAWARATQQRYSAGEFA